MKLTGKCKEDFEEWILSLWMERVENKIFCSHFGDTKEGWFAFDYDDFEKIIPNSMQFGVIQDFADSVGVYDVWVRQVDGRFRSSSHEWFDTRQEARTAAIEKFNELYNNGKEQSTG